ncbi:Hypothetical protein GLP15_1970 [Giardia lamblia P15]|uniref:Uncharacterized protein n=1 Tax=Giardia intestinalis (strain P15) TaxID=658858 RepID=E1EWK9_GIAIA|nr:Hypothetical protein GLP15_1970 [Giardia lamblia P15]
MGDTSFYDKYATEDKDYYTARDVSRTDFHSTYELNPALDDVLNEALYKDVADEGLKEMYKALQEHAGKTFNENKKLTAQLEEITQDKLVLQSSLEDVRGQFQQAQQNIELLLTQMKAADGDIVSLTHANAKIESELEAIRVELFNLREENKRLKAIEADYVEQIERLTEALNEEKKERSRFERKFNEYKQRLNVKASELDELRDKFEVADEERNIYQAECIKGNMTGYSKPAGYSALDIYTLKEDFKSLQEKSHLTSISFKSGKAAVDSVDALSPDDSYKLLEKYGSEPSLAPTDLTSVVKSAKTIVPPRPPKELPNNTYLVATPASEASDGSSTIDELFAKYMDFDTLKGAKLDGTLLGTNTFGNTVEALLANTNKKNPVALNLTLNSDEATRFAKPSLLERHLRQEQFREMQPSMPASDIADIMRKYGTSDITDTTQEKFGNAASRSTSHTLAMSLFGDTTTVPPHTERYWTAEQPLLTKYTADYGF